MASNQETGFYELSPIAQYLRETSSLSEEGVQALESLAALRPDERTKVLILSALKVKGEPEERKACPLCERDL